MSSVDARANKTQALEALREKKRLATQKSANATSHGSSIPHPQGRNNYSSQPAQSRDGSLPSKYFPPAPPQPPRPDYGTILAHNSSPQRPNEPFAMGPHFDLHSQLAASSSQPYAPPWASTGGIMGRSFDPLSAPSTVIMPNNASHTADLRRQRPPETSAFHDAPPRKRQNRGPSAEDAVEVPSSPEINRAGGRRRRLTSGSSVEMSISDDDYLPQPLGSGSGSSSSRLVRERPIQPSASPTAAGTTPLPDKLYQIFKICHVGESEARIAGAWAQAGGDKAKAEALMRDKNWSPPVATPVVPVVTKVEKDVGRVKEIEEANKAQRAIVREKGKASAIYANRLNLETAVPSTPAPPSKSAPSIIDIAGSPTTPGPVVVRRGKRPNRMVYSEEEDTDDDEEEDRSFKKHRNAASSHENRVLDYFNTRPKAALQELIGCSSDQADIVISKRPYTSKDDFVEKLGLGKKKAGPSGLSPKLFDDSVAIFKGYGSVDGILEECETIGAALRSAIASWSPPTQRSSTADLPGDEVEDGALSLRSLAPSKVKDKKDKDFLTKQPALLADKVQLKDYQLLGVNWLNLLYRRELSCILADEMGLGKTIQVISFLAHQKERGNNGPHLIVVPSSTLENWCREFARFAPQVRVQTYYASKDGRPALRQTLNDTVRCKSRSGDGWEVLITTYNLAAQGDERDRKFFKRMNWDCSIFDEGHVLKNFQSQRYQSLLKYESKWRLLLTGTPLQNNLQELISLMNFILPEHFSDQFQNIHSIFKAKGDAKVSLLSQERISRAKKMMTPFVLRRRKDQVLKDLPNKNERIEWCEMTERQRSIYTNALQRSRKTILEANVDTPESGTPEPNGAKKAATAAKRKAAKPKDKIYSENSSNVLMDLRKAASHPMLFRTHFEDADLSGITKLLLREPDFKKRGALFEIVKEDMEVMTDSELQVFCATYKSTRKYLKPEEIYLDAGKIVVLLDLLKRYTDEGRKVLIFSQFTQVLDILQAILKNQDTKFLVLTGSTPVDVRQTLVDEFTEDETIPVFLLSTKAGGMGINLTAASVVIMFDQDFNPHNDRQAQDRAYRIGQKRDVDVVKLISKGTIEEEMLRLGETKLALDQAVSGDTNGEGESAPEREMKTSLMKALRRQLEQDEVNGS